MSVEYKISFPHMGNYYIPIATFVKNTLNAKICLPPKITKKTLELGTKHSPDFVCVPFKYNLGNYIEALENGANVLIQAGGGCRFGYYSEVQEEILRNLGYNFKFFNITSRTFKPLLYYKMFKEINPMLTIKNFLYSFYLIYKQIAVLDKFEDYIRENIGFQINDGDFKRLEKKFHDELITIEKIKDLKSISIKYTKLLKEVPINKPNDCLRVGIVGEIYVLMEPFSSCFLEEELAKKGIEVKRYINISYLLFSKEHKKTNTLKLAKPYLQYNIGADGVDSVAHSKVLAKKGFDGIIHIKPFGCTPEINCMPILEKISEDYKIPILYFSFDSQTSETGVKTRLEAFHDMLLMRKEKNKKWKELT
ncbi:MAG TPA: hypothetical protein DEP72_06695 [Clostridiales bacterium]|nr:MAG: hypothetical protein A2Y18_02560 [Clostridiales bacterium GWD2_32_19]HCC07827.1 hypothetical protein [Clostridiales bacterium]